jgi:L,D-peptidoglycan transpeptidase YkuD (ErfK/YbiS/YcfS/YnhG family)
MRAFVATAGIAGLLSSMCSGASPHPAAARPATPKPSASASASASALHATVTRHPALRHSSPTRAPKPTTTGTWTLPYRGVGSARQVIVIEASGYGTSYATLTAYAKTASGWRREFGPWSARIGYNGFAPSGAKREGDGRTPTGSYGFSFFFGVDSMPGGIHYAWRHAYTYDYWDDDSSSSRYNEWVDTRTASAGRNPEPMHNTPSYDYAAVIAYNTARTPGLGSAIFFHVSHSSATAGCVAVAQWQVLDVLRWLTPSAGPRIIMGVSSAIRT